MDRNSIVKVIALMVTGFGIGIDFTGALMLVPAIENSFDADITSTQWVLNIYALFFAMTMVAGGRLGDMYGHRKDDDHRSLYFPFLIGHVFFLAEP